MGKEGQVLLLLPWLVTLALSFTCRRADWGTSFDSEGISHCAGWHEYINGFFRNNNPGQYKDNLYLLEEAECCSRLFPWTNSKSLVVYADWWAILDQGNSWAYCPAGYFLHGLWRHGESKSWLYHIEEGRCMKPADHPSHHGHCYNHDIGTCFDSKGVCKCNDDYFVTGIYRSGCHELYCLETLRCCKMASGPEALDEKFKVKSRIMDTTLTDMALLADYLGYGWTAGCRSSWVGEDFRRSGDTWAADKSGRCEGYKSDHRLSLAYGDWSFGIKDIQYGSSVVEDLTPDVIDSGTLYNNDPSPATKTIVRSETSIRSVTHTTTSTWTKSLELGVEISYTPPSATGGAGGSMSYTFTYEKSTKTTDSTNNQQKKTFTVSTSKVLPANSAVNWRLIMSKTRTTVPYTATIITRFSAELQGFLRWGGGYNGHAPNYHYQHRGSGDRPTFHYRFGDATTPFYTALKRQSDTNSHPWMWNDMKNKFSYAQTLIDDLSNENRYTFTLTGKFEDVIGKHVDISWDAITSRKRRAEDGQSGDDVASEDGGQGRNHTHVAKAGPADPPAPNPDPPTVDTPTFGSSSQPGPLSEVQGD